MTRKMAILLAMGLMGGCDWSAATADLHPAAKKVINTAANPAASADAEPGLKYPERPPCKVCIETRSAGLPD